MLGPLALVHRAARAAALLVPVLAAGCRAPATEPGLDGYRRPGGTELDWTLGTWRGTRTAASDGDVAAMTLVVRPVLAGAGLTEEIEIDHGEGIYRGFSVAVRDEDAPRWTRSYVNAVRRTFATLEGRPSATEPEAWVWTSVTPGRTREGRLVSERLANGRWRRTMHVSEDGERWEVLFTDQLERAP